MRFPRINRKAILLYLTIMGPGIITATADNDAGGITTYSVVGASYGYEMLWMLFLITFSLGVVQEMCARMGAVTGKGLSDLIRENFGVRWTTFAMLVLLLANFATTVAEFAGIAAGLEIFGVSRYISVPLAALMVWGLVVRGSYRFAERIFLLFALFQGAYVLAGLVTPQDWGLALRSLAVPSFRLEANFVLLFIATIGTTITPWMQFYLQSSVVDKGITASQYRYERLDVLLGVPLDPETRDLLAEMREEHLENIDACNRRAEELSAPPSPPYREFPFASLREAHDRLYYGAWRGPAASIRDIQRAYFQLGRYLGVLADEVQRARSLEARSYLT
ncbi:MAG: divalent metal cation transporter, partial [Chloroflexi bacterium]|nr:divalent metal cation transporter [Chloroflexota bacterium]